MKKALIPIISLILMLGCACSSGASKTASAQSDTPSSAPQSPRPVFSGDSAYAFVARQVEFGPRVPGSESHRKCAEYLIEKIGSYTDTVLVDKVALKDHTSKKVDAYQILGRINPQAQRRILLLAHWDTRPWADADPDPANHNKPVPGANDGGSGVGVILEIARQLSLERPDMGVDMLLTDLEDSGKSGDDDGTTWAVGTQWWVENMPYNVNDKPMYAILFDMVGGRDAVFTIEGFSQMYARNIVSKVWKRAEQSGLAARFPKQGGGYVIDDHVFLNRAGIPAIDIIENNNPMTNSFNPTWHTLQDDMDHIDPNTLRAAGQTILDLIYQEDMIK